MQRSALARVADLFCVLFRGAIANLRTIFYICIGLTSMETLKLYIL